MATFLQRGGVKVAMLQSPTAILAGLLEPVPS